MVLSLKGVSKSFGPAQVLKSIDLEVREGEFVSLLGPSGCGKTTTLNIIAGFLSPEAGDVLIGGRRVNDVPVHRRDLGMVFQGHALFPHMTCFDNVAFGLRMRRLSAEAVRKRVLEALDLVHLTGFESRFPRELSGGQQQRVGLARALAIQPRILLLDEPLSNLDAKLRRAMQAELRAIHTRVRTTMVYVTHDQEEALTLSDRVAVMNGGAIEQLDAPQEVYQRPRTRFVADFIGSSSFLEGTVAEAWSGRARIAVADAGHVLVETREPLQARARVHLGVRSDRVRIVPVGQGLGEGELSGQVVDRAFAGAHFHVIVAVGGGRHVTAHLTEPPEPDVIPGANVRLKVAPADWMVLQ